MKLSIYLLVLNLTVLQIRSHCQSAILQPGTVVTKKLLKGESHPYAIHLQKGEYSESVVNQKGVDIAIDLIDPSGKKIKTFDSPTGKNGPEPISIEALQTGRYQLNIYPLVEQGGMPDSLMASWVEENQGEYSISDITILSVKEYKQKLAQLKKDEMQFDKWITNNAHKIKTVDANNGFEDLQYFKFVLKDVRVVGLGEASHGTSEFFRMKHRMLEFLVKEMGYTSFYIEASMTRCRYINDYVLHGKGNLDTATAIQGFATWRVEEVKNMIEWMKEYNDSVSEDRKVKFFGYDLQINDKGWEELRKMYARVDIKKLPHLDSLNSQLDSASAWSNNANRQIEGEALFKTLYRRCLDVLNDMVLNEGQYQYVVGKKMYAENLMNLKLIVQEIESYKDGYNDRRDYYMAQNIFHLLNQEKPEAKVMVWAHNGHIEKSITGSYGSMGHFLSQILEKNYYALGFEFYSGSFQTRNLDINNKSANWDVMTVGAPPEKSLAWHMNKTGTDKFFLDFRNTGTESVINFSKKYDMHSFGSMYSANWPATYPAHLNIFDGLIFIKNSTAAKNFTKVYLRRH